MEDVVTGLVLLSAEKDFVDDVKRFVELLNTKISLRNSGNNQSTNDKITANRICHLKHRIYDQKKSS